MNQQIRFLLFAFLSVGILFFWQLVFAPPPSPPEQQAEIARSEQPAAEPPVLQAPAPVAEEGAQGEEGEGPAAEAVREPEEKRIEVETALWKAVFNTRGAALDSFKLLGKKETTRAQAENGGEIVPRDLVHPDPNQRAPLSGEIVLPSGVVGPNATWEVEEQPDALVFTRQQGSTKLTRRYSWEEGSHALSLETSVEGGGLSGEIPVRLFFTAWEKPVSSGGFMGMGGTQEVHRAICRVDGDIEKLSWTDSGEQSFSGRPDFVGIDEKYFLSALIPLGDAPASCTIAAPRPGALEATLERLPRAEGGRASTSFSLYLGPKDVDLLKAAGHRLDESVDYGFLASIARLLLVIMKLFEGLVGNWGVAIILLTLLMKIITFPLTHRQMKSMEEMRKLAPKLEEIKKKFNGDQQRINLETMKLYKDHNVQPLGGCFPMLIQMPVWFALYTMLSNSFELYNEPFIAGWISDLTSKDPYYITPILMTVTMVLSQLLTPQSAQAQQMKWLMYGMPIFFGFIMMSLPAGLVLYIFTNNILSIGQSLWFRRTHMAAEAKA